MCSDEITDTFHTARVSESWLSPKDSRGACQNEKGGTVEQIQKCIKRRQARREGGTTNYPELLPFQTWKPGWRLELWNLTVIVTMFQTGGRKIMAVMGACPLLSDTLELA